MEMALISETFKQAPTLPQASSSTSVHPSEHRTVETENSGVSSQDATLLEIQEKTKETRDQKPVKSKKQKRERRAPQRGIPMREDFFCENWLDTLLYIRPSRSFGQSPHGLVPYVQEKRFHQNKRSI